MYNNTTRVPGGSCYGDSVFRTTASPQSYARTMFQKVISKRSFNPDEIRYFSTEDFFMLVYQQKPLLVENFDFVEMKRSEGVHAFEEWLSKTILQMVRSI